MILNSCYSHRGGGIVIPKVGDTVSIGEIDYLVVHHDQTNDYLYFCKKYCDKTEDTQFGASALQSTYGDETFIFNKCKNYYETNIPKALEPLMVIMEYCKGCPIFIPTIEQVVGMNDIGADNTVPGEWEYFRNEESRIYKDSLDTGNSWWLQSQYKKDSSKLYLIGYSGKVSYDYPNKLCGFRPCFCMDISAITKYSVLAELFGS